MSKKSENESVKQKEVKPKTEQEKIISETSDLKEQEKVDQTENEGTESKLKKLEEDKLRLLAEIENNRKDFQRQMEYSYKYSNRIFVSQVLDFLVELEEKALKAMQNDLEDNHKSETKVQGKEELLQKSEIANKQNELVQQLKKMIKQLETENEQLKKEQELFTNKFKGYLVGIKIIKDNLKRRLEDEGVKEIEVKVGKDRADSRHHKLIEKVENDNLPEGTIVEVVEKGYFLHGEVARKVRVKTAEKSKKN